MIAPFKTGGGPEKIRGCFAEETVKEKGKG